MVLTEKQAYQAMFQFLEEIYERTHYDEIGALLGQMQLLADGGSADPAIWQDWLRCTNRILSGATPE